MKKLKILIIGAGPTGLTLAANLFKKGIACRIIEKRINTQNLSKAIAIQAGTLCCFDATLGNDFTLQLINSGRKVDRIHFHFEKNVSTSLDLSFIPKPYPFVLLLEQFKTESLLNSLLLSLGGKVEYGIEALSLKQSSHGVRVEFNHGTQEEFDYVIGCDGLHSIVREEMQIPFEGKTYKAQFTFADVELEWPQQQIIKEDINLILHPQGFLALFPYQQEGQFRLGSMIKNKYRAENESIEEFKKQIHCRATLTPEIKSIKWISHFNISQKMVEKYRSGRLFLAGDAAHVHSPIGGQGMNLGIVDALNLSYKLYLLANGIDLLDTYSVDRVPIARAVVNKTDTITSFGIKEDHFLSAFGRNKIMPYLIEKKWIQRKLAKSLSQFDVAQKEIESWLKNETK